ncbi:MAG: Ger(x)C family spore germination protein [Bacillota bacterium]
MRVRALRFFLFLCFFFFAPGCWDQRVIERMEFIATAGVDARPGGRILLGVITPAVGEGEGKPKPHLYFTEVDCLRQGRERLRLQASGELEAGKMEQIFFGEEMARRGIVDYLDILTRDPFNPVQAHLAVVKGTAEDFLRQATRWQHLPFCGLYLDRLLDYGAAAGSVPRTDITRFYVAYYAPGIDPIAPLVRATPSRALLCGTALFRDDRLVGELNGDETFLLLALCGKARSHSQTFPIPADLRKEKKALAVRFVKAGRKMELHLWSGRPKVSFTLSFTGMLMEFRAGRPLQPEELRRLEGFIACALAKEAKKLWATLRALDVDPLGIGNLIRAYYHEFWERHDWRRVFPQFEAEFRVKVDLVNSGAIR